MTNKFKKNHGRIILSLGKFASPTLADKISRGKQFYKFCNHSETKVFFVTDGDFIVRSKNTDKIINIISAPFVIGAMPSISPSQIYLEKIDYGRIHSIEYGFFWRLVYNNALEKEVMTILSEYHTDLLNYMQTQNPDVEKYTLNLIQRWNLFPCHIKKRFSLLYFVTNTSFLSKSTASRTLKRLKCRGIIHLERGRLLTTKDISGNFVV